MHFVELTASINNVLPGIAVHIDGFSRLVFNAVVNARALIFIDASTFTIQHQPGRAHTARHALCADLFRTQPDNITNLPQDNL